MKQTTRWISLLCVLLAVTLTGGAACPDCLGETGLAKFTGRELSIFDTEITLIGFAPSQAAFDQVWEETLSYLRRFDKVFDGYNGYEGLHNLYYLNRRAAKEPVEVPDELFALVSWCKDQWDAGLRTTNIAMGAVLSIWHEYREAGLSDPASAALPPMEELKNASQHVSMDDVILDKDKQTVFFADPNLTLDLGAVAKGWAADAVLPMLTEKMPSFLLSLGGNVYAGDPPRDGRSAWAVGVQQPRPEELRPEDSQYLDIIDLTGLTVVTSGDYWRYYVVDGQRYHHIIDPVTLMPSRTMMSVTVICESSVLADFLSTTLFVLSYEDGLHLVESMEGVEAMWVLADGAVKSSPGMAAFARSLKNAAGGAP